MTKEEFIKEFAIAIATQEGYFIRPEDAKKRGIKYPTKSQRQNNPGNLRSWGYYPIVENTVSFPNPQKGWDALYQQIVKNINRGLTLGEFFTGKEGVYYGFAPSKDSNSPVRYAQMVGKLLGISCAIPLNKVIMELKDSPAHAGSNSPTS